MGSGEGGRGVGGEGARDGAAAGHHAHSTHLVCGVVVLQGLVRRRCFRLCVGRGGAETANRGNGARPGVLSGHGQDSGALLGLLARVGEDGRCVRGCVRGLLAHGSHGCSVRGGCLLSVGLGCGYCRGVRLALGGQRRL